MLETLVTPLIGSLGGIANGQSGYSDSINIGIGGSIGGSYNNTIGDSWGNSYGENWSNGYNDSWGSSITDNYSSGEGNSWGYNQSENTGESWNNGASSNAVYGSEASAKDILRTQEANAMQDYFNKQQMKYNTEEAEKARAWEEYMSNTSYQRAVADLKKAGLNPILAAMNMGASTPSAISASSGLASATKAQTYADSRGSSYNTGGSYNHGYSKGENGSYYYSKSEGHGRSYNESHGKNQSGGYNYSNQGSHNESHGESNQKSNNWNYGKSHSETTNNLLKAIDGIGDFVSGLTSAFKGFGKGKFDGYNNPTVSN